MDEPMLCNYCGTDTSIEHDCIDVLNQRIRDERRIIAALEAENA